METSRPESGKSISGEQQDKYDIFVAQGIKMASQMAPEMKGVNDPELVSDAMFNIVNRIETEGSKNGVRFDLTVMLHGSNEIMGYLMRAAGIQLNEDQMKQAVGGLVGKYLKNALSTNKMSKDDVLKLSEDAAESQEKLTKQGEEFLGGQNGVS